MIHGVCKAVLVYANIFLVFITAQQPRQDLSAVCPKPWDKRQKGTIPSSGGSFYSWGASFQQSKPTFLHTLHTLLHTPGILLYYNMLRFSVCSVCKKNDYERFCVNLGGNGLLQSLTNYLIIKALVNEIKLQMCVFFRIFVCEFKSEKAPVCMAQRYEEIWTYASNRPDKISRD